MSLSEDIKNEIANHRWQKQREDFFNNGTEVALMRGFTKKAQEAFLNDVADVAIRAGKPKAKSGMKNPEVKHVEYQDKNPNHKYDQSLNEGAYDRLYKKYLAGEKEPGYEDFDPKFYEPRYFTTGGEDIYLKPKAAAAEAKKAFLDAFHRLSEKEQDAWLYGQRFKHSMDQGNLKTMYPGATKGDIAIFKGRVPNSYSSYQPTDRFWMKGPTDRREKLHENVIPSEREILENEITPDYRTNYVALSKEQEPEDFALSLIHEGGHRTMGGPLGVGDYAVDADLGKTMSDELVDALASADNKAEMANDLTGGNKLVTKRLSDWVSMHPDYQGDKWSDFGSFSHNKGYQKGNADSYKYLYGVQPSRLAEGQKLRPLLTQERLIDEISNYGALSTEGAAEILEILSTPQGASWMEQKMPVTYQRFKEIINKAIKESEDALGPDGSVPDRYNVNFHPELAD